MPPTNGIRLPKSSKLEAVGPTLEDLRGALTPRTLERLSNDLAEWWRNLGAWGAAKKGDFYKLNDVASISSHFRCPDNEHTIRSRFHPFPPINGSKIEFDDYIYQIGQSPTFESLPKIISYGLESGQGLVQIVSDETHQRRDSSKTIAGMLQNALSTEAAKKSGLAITKLWSPEKFILTGITEKIPPGGYPEGSNYRQYSITLKQEVGPGEYYHSTLPLTQIGLPFENATLMASDIKCASDIVTNEHAKFKNKAYATKFPLGFKKENIADNVGPLILTKLGHGRNATVVTYQAICKRIAQGKIINAVDVQNALKPMIEEGRAARPFFVHSRAQVEQLQIALELELQKHREKNKPSKVNMERLDDFQKFARIITAGMRPR